MDSNKERTVIFRRWCSFTWGKSLLFPKLHQHCAPDSISPRGTEGAGLMFKGSCGIPGHSGAANGLSINPAPGALWSSARHQPGQEPHIVPLTPTTRDAFKRVILPLWLILPGIGKKWAVSVCYRMVTNLFTKLLCLFNSRFNQNTSLWSLQRHFFGFGFFSGCTDRGMLKMCVLCHRLRKGYEEMFQVLLIFVCSQMLFS